jgi:predicted house-cleaning noncanonical NTP pyrophosphatase (MazG superfamily)
MNDQTEGEQNTRIYYNKLCRDKIPEIIAGKGFDCEVRITDHDEYRKEIVRKVLEEASGVSNHADHYHLVAELADLVITMEAVKKEFNVSNEELDGAVARSLDEKGGYEKRLYLAWSSDTDYVSKERGSGLDD